MIIIICYGGIHNNPRLRTVSSRYANLKTEEFMQTKFTRRSLLTAGASMLALGALPYAHAQARTKLRFSSAFTEQDLRAAAYKSFATAIKDGYDFEPYWGNTLFKQGTELMHLEPGSLPT